MGPVSVEGTRRHPATKWAYLKARLQADAVQQFVDVQTGLAST